MKKNEKEKGLTCAIVGDKDHGYDIIFNYEYNLSPKTLIIHPGFIWAFDIVSIRRFFEQYLEDAKN